MDYDSATGWWVRRYRPGESKMDVSGGSTGKRDLCWTVNSASGPYAVRKDGYAGVWRLAAIERGQHDGQLVPAAPSKSPGLAQRDFTGY
ncbi:hypothetical protein H2515_08880 [Acidithiobacillus ferrivorans]|uniref:Uncharacterized protein n=2 Tax=Acidithiobacillus ferrivorans TaxID=160808 RepID=A0A7T4WBZ2_9PROT|nr:hypothetical protein H2515_08880 [Acidithiobacillus ferrivorans]